MKLLKRRPSAKKDVKKAVSLLKKLLALRLVRILSIIFLFLLISPLVLFYFIRPKIQEDINYGVTFSNRYATEIGLDWKRVYTEILDDLKVKNIRLIAYWDDIESENDVFDYGDIKWQIEEAQKRDVNVILTMGRKVPRWPECFEPIWWKEIEDKQLQNNELFEYIKQTTLALKGYDNIVMWQVENEPFFKFGKCPLMNYGTVRNEINIVRSLDDRPIMTQDSGEGGFWFPSYALGDYMGISMYRKIWFDFWGALLGQAFYFKYPLAHWTYKVRAFVLRVPYQKIVVTELQGEPWGPRINSELTEKEKNQTMSRNDFLDVLSYSQKSGFSDFYLWGVEWWYWEKELNNKPFYWNTAKALFN